MDNRRDQSEFTPLCVGKEQTCAHLTSRGKDSETRQQPTAWAVCRDSEYKKVRHHRADSEQKQVCEDNSTRMAESIRCICFVFLACKGIWALCSGMEFVLVQWQIRFSRSWLS